MGFRGNSEPFLIVSAAQRLCALGLGEVRETFRPPSIKPVQRAPHFIAGVAVIRGNSVPVVDLGTLLNGAPTEAQRVVTLGVGAREIALLVESVLGVRALDEAMLAAAPALLGPSTTDVVAALGSLDAELLLVLRSGRIVPSEAWPLLTAAGVAGAAGEVGDS